MPNPFSMFLRCYCDFINSWVKALELTSFTIGSNKIIDYHDIAQDRRWDGSNENR